MSDTLYTLCFVIIGLAFSYTLGLITMRLLPFIALALTKVTKKELRDLRSVHDYWTGVCYKCGDKVNKKDLVTLGNGSKPDKHFHSWCWPPVK